jgi:hypothetical protein
MLILRCQEKEQEGLDKLDELNARLFEMEDERLSLENLLQDYTEIDRERVHDNEFVIHCLQYCVSNAFYT